MRRVTAVLLALLFLLESALAEDPKPSESVVEVTGTKTISDDALYHGDFLNPYGVLAGTTAASTSVYGLTKAVQAVRLAGSFCRSSLSSVPASDSYWRGYQTKRAEAPPRTIKSTLSENRSLVAVLALLATSAATANIEESKTKLSVDFKGALPTPIDSHADDDTVALDFYFNVSCPETRDPIFRGVMGYVHHKGRLIRVDLHEREHFSRVLLGSHLKEDLPPVFVSDKQSRCELVDLIITPRYLPNPERFSPEQKAQVWEDPKLMTALSARYAPFIQFRPDQFGSNDLPLNLSVSVLPGNSPKTKILAYTQIWSDESTVSTSDAAYSQMGRYGRASDIERVLDVEIDTETLKPVAASYHGGATVIPFKWGLGHGFWPLKDPSQTNPVLSNIAHHNTLSDENPSLSYPYGHSLAPLMMVKDPAAREQPLFFKTWMLDVTHQELRREGKGILAPEHFVYVKLRANENNLGALHKLIANVNIDGKTYSARGTLDRLGEDLFGKESYMAIPLGENDEEARAVIEKVRSPKVSKEFFFEEKGIPRVVINKEGGLEFFMLIRNSEGDLVTVVLE